MSKNVLTSTNVLTWGVHKTRAVKKGMAHQRYGVAPEKLTSYLNFCVMRSTERGPSRGPSRRQFDALLKAFKRSLLKAFKRATITDGITDGGCPRRRRRRRRKAGCFFGSGRDAFLEVGRTLFWKLSGRFFGSGQNAFQARTAVTAIM